MPFLRLESTVLEMMNEFDFNNAPWQNEVLVVPLATDPTEAFMTAAEANGLQGLSHVIPDGQIHRFPDKNGSGWYVFYPGDFPAGAAGDWKTGATMKWSLHRTEALSIEQQAAYHEMMDRTIALQNAAMDKRRIDARTQAAVIISGAGPAPVDHPYLVKKRVTPDGAFNVGHGCIGIPIGDFDQPLASIQFIYADGAKKFLPGGEISGMFHRIGTAESTTVAVCEGWATGKTIHQATGWTVYVALNTSNLPKVAIKIRERYAGSRLVICGDNDAFTVVRGEPTNPGIIAATKAAKETGADMMFPKFADVSTKPTDYNDLAVLEGISMVKDQLMGPVAPRALKFDTQDWVVSAAYKGNAPGIEWLVNGVFQLGQVAILAAMGDAGKGMMTLDLALKVALSPADDLLGEANMAFGNPVACHGPAVIYTAEDSMEEVHRRLEAINPCGAWRHTKRLYVVPLPNAGGPIPLVKGGRMGPECTPFYYGLRDQLLSLSDLKLIVLDPLASFISADINADPAVGAYTTGLLAALATETGACVLVAHHLNKGSVDKPIRTVEQARNAVRGSTAIVDGIRSLYCLWQAEYSEAKNVCKKMNVAHDRNRVFYGAVAKSNGPADRNIKIFLRSDRGLLTSINHIIERMDPTDEDYKIDLESEAGDAADAGHPYSRTGNTPNSLYARRGEFKSKALQELSRSRLEKISEDLLIEGRLVLAASKGSGSKKYLCRPGSAFACGIGEIMSGAAPKK